MTSLFDGQQWRLNLNFYEQNMTIFVRTLCVRAAQDKARIGFSHWNSDFHPGKTSIAWTPPHTDHDARTTCLADFGHSATHGVAF